MENDDLPIGRALSRREALGVLGSSGALLLLASSPSAVETPGRTRSRYPCVVRPASTQGPYFVDERLNRSDIRSDPTDGTVKAGAILALTLNVSALAKGTCRPLEGAIVDLWQCDAEGVYSDAKDPSYFDTTGKKFLRGYQITDKDGIARFTTIYPGWYPGRTPHIHYKIRSPESGKSPFEFIGQMYFPERTSDRIYATPPYAARGKRSVSNVSDRIFNRDGGRQSLLVLAPVKDGFTSTFDVALQVG
jgi:protocatechuate 3,4-dioxygenase beta subunit